MRKISTYLAIILLAITSCRKKYPESVINNEPAFFAKLSVNNQPVELQAGKDNYYMYASHELDTNNVYGFVSELRRISCESCGPALKILVKDKEVSRPGNIIKIDSALAVKQYPLFTGHVSSYKVQFKSLYNKMGISHRWDFGDGSILDSVFLPEVTHTFASHGKYNVCVSVTGGNSCHSSVCNTQAFGNNALRASVTTKDAIQSSMRFVANVWGGTPPYQYTWSFGDNKPEGTSKEEFHTYDVHGGYPVVLRVKDANNNTVVVNYNAVTSGDQSSCATNFLISDIIEMTTNPLMLSNVVITWRDTNGKVYTTEKPAGSDLPDEPGSFFQVTGVDDFDRNEKNELTKKYRVKFKCRVYNGNESLLLDNAEAVLCTSYK